MEFAVPAVILSAIAYLLIRRNREHTENAPLRGEIEALASFRTPLYRASVLRTGAFGGTRDRWTRLIGPQRLVIGADAFMISAPQALREYVFRGCESSIAFAPVPGQPSRQDAIVITGQTGARKVRLAISADNLPEVWQALAGTGATLEPAAGQLELTGGFASALSRMPRGRRVAIIAGVVIFPFIPALATLVYHHLP